MLFPLADWINDHSDCRHNLAQSGMRGSIAPPTPTARDLRAADPKELRRRLADLLGTDPSGVFLTHGATEGNAAVLQFLGRRKGRSGACRVRRPEYPPLLDAARWSGFRLTERAGPAHLAVISQPRNPEGDLWDLPRLVRWTEGAANTLVDETFREFANAPSLSELGDSAVWRTGSFTKFYAADALRVGFVVAPPEEVPAFARYHGLLCSGLSDYSVAAAEVALRNRESFRREVGAVLAPNRELWRSRFPSDPVPVAPVAFDRAIPEDREGFVGRCLGSSVLVCPGRLFEEEGGVRICLTRRSFPRDLAAYLRVREAARRDAPKRVNRRRRSPRVRSLPGSSARERAGRA